MIDIFFIMAKMLKILLNPPAIRGSKIHKTSKVCSGSNIVNTEMDRYSYIANYCQSLNVNIGSFCSIGDYCYIGSAKHPIEWASTSPVFYNGRNVMKKNFTKYKIEDQKKTFIGNDVWIGSMCLIKEGVTIGNGAIVGMGSVVTKDVEAYSIVGGNPAKLIRKRFSDEIIGFLDASEWWLLKDDELKEVGLYIKDAEIFTDKVNQLIKNRK